MEKKHGKKARGIGGGLSRFAGGYINAVKPDFDTRNYRSLAKVKTTSI
jgi:hypothetical protein